MKKFRKYFKPAVEIIFFIFALGIFCYSGYKVADYYGLLGKKVSAEETCGQCSACDSDNWLGELCRKIRDWCQGNCYCHPSPTQPPVPTPTSTCPTPTGVIQPTVIPTGSQETPTPTPTVGQAIGGDQGGGGGDGGGPASPCSPPEAPKPPVLLTAVNIASDQIRLTWQKVDRATHYAIAYGEASRNYIYGNPNVGDVDTYVVGGLQAGRTYFFVVSAAIGGDCPIGSPYSNELSNRVAGAGINILGLSTDPPTSTPLPESPSLGEVEGAKDGSACPYWWYVLIGQTVLLGGIYALWLKRKNLPRRWGLVAPATVLAAYLVDRYAHTHWFVPSKTCPWEFWLGSLTAILETAGFRFLRNRTV